MSSGTISRPSQQSHDVQELQSLRVGFTFRDEERLPIPKADVTSLTLTLYDARTGDIVNSRDNQDVLDNHGVTLGATNGEVRWSVSTADTAIGDDTADTEQHVGLFTVRWGTDKAFSHMVILNVINLRKRVA